MIKATEQPNLQPEYGRRTFRLLNDYSYQGVIVPGDESAGLGKGFVCDGASIPRFLWSVVGVRLGGRIKAGALVHDWIYYNCGDVSGNVWFDRRDADGVFANMMRAAGMERRRMFMCYWAVRLFGWRAWNAHKRRIALDKHLDEIEREADDGGDA